MTIRNCTEVRPLLMAYLDSELDATTTLSLSEHLSNCESCRSRLEAEQQIEAGLAEIARNESMPRDVGARLDELLASQAGAAARRPWILQLSGMAAAALVLVALGLWLQDDGNQSAPPLAREFAAAYEQYVATPPMSQDLILGGLDTIFSQARFDGLSLPAGGFAGPEDHPHPIELLGSREMVVAGVRGVNVAYDCCGAITSVLVLPVEGLPSEVAEQLPPGATLDLEVGGLKTRAVRRDGLIIGVSSRHSVVLADEISS